MLHDFRKRLCCAMKRPTQIESIRNAKSHLIHSVYHSIQKKWPIALSFRPLFPVSKLPWDENGPTVSLHLGQHRVLPEGNKSVPMPSLRTDVSCSQLVVHFPDEKWHSGCTRPGHVLICGGRGSLSIFLFLVIAACAVIERACMPEWTNNRLEATNITWKY